MGRPLSWATGSHLGAQGWVSGARTASGRQILTGAMYPWGLILFLDFVS